MLLRIVILSGCLLLGVKSQENAGSSVAKSLIECYNKSENLDRERRPSSSITVLIDLIRKIEAGPSLQNDRLFSKEIIHRFKQDGIVTYTTSASNPYSIPYTPKGMQSEKHKILLTKLVPGNAANFPNETLSEIQRCSLHFMLSNSMDLRQRGDENTVCNKLDRYQRRVRRDVDPNDDVELIDSPKSSPFRGNLQQGTETEFEGEERENAEDQVDTEVFQQPNSRKSINVHLSECPLENGVVYSKWGAFQAGTVIAGLAAGLEPQKINVEENYQVNNVFAATLSGDLAEVGLHQGAAGKDPLVVGANGGWNGTQTPKWYFIQKNSDFHMTDAEIRGGLDGLIIGSNIKNWQSKATSLKMSQVLDMYYTRGVFSKKFRACNRKTLFTEVAPQADLTSETIAFSFLLNVEAKLPGSLSSEGIKAYGEKAVNALNNYIATLPDLACEVEDDTILRISTDIVIVLDTQWSFNTVHRALAYLLDNLDINKYDSNFTMINGQNGAIIVNSSYSLLDFYEQYNRTVHTQNPTGFNVNQIFNVIEAMTKRKMDQPSRKAGGPSSVVLFMPYGTLSGSDANTATDRKAYFKRSLPDLKLLVLGRNAQEAYSSLVVDPVSDAFSLSETTDGTSITSSVKSVIARVKQIPRRIINPNCGSSWSGGASSDSFDQYVEPNSTNYYRVAPNYIFGEGTRSVKVRGYGYGTLVACTSRQIERPGNSTDDCKTISSASEVSFILTDACKNYDEVVQCLPAYFSVEAVGTGESTNIRCTDDGCRFPDNIKYTIQIENFACISGTYRIMGNIVTLMMTFATIKFFF